jgi:agmatinase
MEPAVFMGATASTTPEEADAHAMLFAAPHGTPYPGISNRVHEATGRAVRASFGAEAHWVDHWNYDVGGPLLGERGFRLADLGDLPTVPDDGAGNRALIEDRTRRIVARGAVPLMLGGDDSVPIPFLAGLAAAGPVTILQVDAHIDWRQQRRGEPLGYSSTMRRASEMEHVEGIVQVGMRGYGSARREEVDAAAAWGAQIVTAYEVHEHGVGAALMHLPPDARVVITFDCDALDPSAMPAVMAPTPGGLTYAEAIALISGVAERATIAGFDLIEFVPSRDPDGSAATTAASLVSHVIGTLAAEHRP